MTVRSGGGAATRRYTEAGTSYLLILLAAVFAFGISFANAEEPSYELDIPAQELDGALKALAVATDRQVLFSRSVVGERTSPPVNGEYNTVEAMELLLADSGLVYDVTRSNVLLVKENAAELGDDSGKFQPASSLVLMAQSQTSAEQSQTSQAGTTTNNNDETVASSQIEEIIVTGTNIRGVGAVGSQVLAFDREDIDATGIVSVPAFIESLPQNFGLIGADGSAGSGGLGDLPGVFANQNSGTSIDLRGLGQGTTLTLLNGRRMAPGFQGTAVDISALPLSAIERIDVLTDGASAIYGSDAIGGVVNFILRDDFEGAETRASYGIADSLNEYRLAQAFGSSWSTGNALLSLQYSDRDNLESADRSFSQDSLVVDLLPEDEQSSIVLAGKQRVGEATELFVETFWSQRDTINRGLASQQQSIGSDNETLNVIVGVRWTTFGDWEIETSGSHAALNSTLDVATVFSSDLIFDQTISTESEFSRFDIKADGSLLDLPGGAVMLAVGGAWRREDLKATSENLLNGVARPLSVLGDGKQDVSSLFLEAYLPFVGAANANEIIQRFDISLAGRYEDYSSFGSSFDPKFGLVLTTLGGFNFRGSYGTSYKAPTLRDYNAGRNFTVAEELTDPLSPLETLTILEVGGLADSYEAQTADTVSVGFDYVPGFAPGLSVSATYYSIDFKNRITTPPSRSSVVLSDPVAFAPILTYNPTAEQVAAAIAVGEGGQGFFDFTLGGFSPEAADVIADLRKRNLSTTETRGIDFQFDYELPTEKGGFLFGLNASHIIDLDEQITATSEPFSRLNRIFGPVDLRLRGSLLYTRGVLSSSMFVNHIPSYIDDRDVGMNRKIGSYTTVDLRASFELGKDFDSGMTSGLQFAVSAQNVFDTDPPDVLIRNPTDRVGFDPATANPLGRFVSVELRKTW